MRRCICPRGFLYLLCVYLYLVFFFFKQKTAYEMRISDWSSDVCSSDLPLGIARGQIAKTYIVAEAEDGLVIVDQHAAHERLVLEQLRRGMTGQAVPSQGLLLPEVVEIDEPACDRLEAAATQDRTSTRLTPVTNAHIDCSLMLEQKKILTSNHHINSNLLMIN